MSHTTLAPSEKHLEDWIVANPQKFLFGHYLADDWETPIPFIDYIVARQVRFPYGIADLFVKCPMSTAVIELKKGVIDAATVAQCLRYMNCLYDIRMVVHIDMWQRDPGFTKPFDDNKKGVICGHSLADKHLPFICEAVGIIPVLYEYANGEYTFTALHHKEVPDEYNHYADRARGSVGDAIRQELIERPVPRWFQKDGAQ